MNTTSLTHTLKEGHIYYYSPAAAVRLHRHGFFRLSIDGRSLEGRYVHGRGIHRICSIENVIDFEEISK